MDGRSFAAVLLAGGSTGSELTSSGIVHPALWKLEHPEQVRAQRLIFKRFGTVDPFLIAANDRRMLHPRHRSERQTQTLALSPGGCYATMLAITLIGSLPINLRVIHRDEDNGDRGGGACAREGIIIELAQIG